jgi:outer membrane protein TolC
MVLKFALACSLLLSGFVCAVALADEVDDVQKLRQKRVDVAEKRLELSREHYRSGLLLLDRVLIAQSQLSDAQYEAAITRAARLTALEQAVKVAEELLDMANKRFAGGSGSQLDIFQAEYALLTAKLRLAEEKQRLATR